MSKWDSNVDNIMKGSDAAVDEQLSKLMASQVELQKSKSNETKENTKTAKAE